MKLAKFRAFIYSKMEHKTNNFVEICILVESPRNPSIDKMRLFSQYDNHEQNYKLLNDMCFSLILSNAILLLIISWTKQLTEIAFHLQSGILEEQVLFNNIHCPLSSAVVLVILQIRENWKEPLPYNTGVMALVVF